ncbi:MAG: DJ-1/PfpI family protein [Firmicutes bacterium]|nr:DJ-1/PfpI family protein [Bacillota bacterium]
MTDFSILLFDGFETLDAMGPAEIIGILPGLFRLRYCSLQGGIVTSDQGLRADTDPASTIPPGGVLLIPGGAGTRQLIRDPAAVRGVAALSDASEYTLTVCTGALLLGKTGLLDGRDATTNKLLFDSVAAANPHVRWHRKARWVQDGKYYTSSGVTAGMDMVLGFIRDTVGGGTASAAARDIEFLWNEDKDSDPFA